MTYRVLIVDDDPNILLSLEFLMRQQGYEAVATHNGEEALRLAAHFRPDLVLLDVMMPAPSGFEVCRQLRADPQHIGIKILILTARGRESEVRRGLDEGANSYVTKPFATRELITRVHDLLTA